MQIQLEHVSKGYRLKSKAKKIREVPADLLAALRLASHRESRDFWALRDVTFNVSSGESLGIVGHNGAGKSTILRLIGGITYPSKGVVKVRGRVGALIEIGAGMHPDLTGRENIHLFGAMLGLSREEVRRRFDAIVDFSEVEKFLDQPLKWYSSGMKVRLGFAVAAFLHPDVLLIDEVLAVGDIRFQQKCVNRIQSLHQGGTTIVFVSHALRHVGYVCQRALWLADGRIIIDGPSAEVIRQYSAAAEQEFAERARVASEKSTILVRNVALTDARGQRRYEFAPGEDLVVGISYSMQDKAPDIEVFLKIVDGMNRALIVARSGALARSRIPAGEGVARCVFPSLPLGPGNYHVWGRVVRVRDDHDEVPWQPMAVFAVPFPDTMDRSWKDILPSEMPLLTLKARWSLDGAERPSDLAETSTLEFRTSRVGDPDPRA